MGKCPDCDFDGTNGNAKENTQFPLGYASESRITLDKDGRMVKNQNGSPKWGTRSRCPLCGCTKSASKPKAKVEINA